MPEWRRLIRQRLTSVNIPAVDEMDIVEELAQHVEDRYAELVSAGASEDEAVDGSLEELDGETLAAEMLDVIAGKVPNDS